MAELDIRGPERIALTGPNGAGKTTLLRAMAGAAPLDGVTVRRRARRSATCRSGSTSSTTSSPWCANVRAAAPRASRQRGAGGAGPVPVPRGPGDQVAGTLSGGERFRAVLAALLLASPPPQLLLLDEPTNSLDLASAAQLAQALSCYQGALLVASHDVPFLRVDRDHPLAAARPLRRAPADRRSAVSGPATLAA